MSGRAVYQFAPQICRHDAISNEIFAIQRVLASSGIESHIACDLADTQLPGKVQSWSKEVARKSRLTIVHYSHGSPSHDRIFSSPEPKVLFYHNITPAKYFRGTHDNLVRASELGRTKLSRLAEFAELATTHSEFSAGELREHGFRRVEILPYIRLNDLDTVEPDQTVVRRLSSDDWVNLICVGQVAPHKCIEDCILAFHYFKQFIYRKSRLLIIGGWGGTEAYLARLQRLVKTLDLADVIFTGRVSQPALIAFYRTAHALLCMSEHEGFCVPLVEAMHHGVPIFAYAAAAVPETLRDSGVMFSEKSWPTIAEAIGVLLADPILRAQIVGHQREQLGAYSLETCQARLRSILGSLSTTES